MDVEWYRASASMPLVSNIVEIDGQKMLDGGIADPIPIHEFQKMGYDRNVLFLPSMMVIGRKKAVLFL